MSALKIRRLRGVSVVGQSLCGRSFGSAAARWRWTESRVSLETRSIGFFTKRCQSQGLFLSAPFPGHRTSTWRSLCTGVDDLATGLYVLVRDTSQRAALEKASTNADHRQRPVGCPQRLDLYCLTEADAQQTAREMSCFQDIASDGCFSLGMIAKYEDPLERYGPWFYPRLFWEAGVIGQVLYLEAKAAGMRSTGIGCYFDDPMHSVLGLEDRTYQDLYHFTVGGPIEDTRLTTLPAYPDEP